mgnify:CR=1 FL=1
MRPRPHFRLMVPYWRLSAYYFFYFAFIGAFSPYFTIYLKSLEFSAWDIGVLMSLMQVMRLLAPNLWGWLADRYGAKTPIVRGAALMSLFGFSCFFFTHSFAGFFIGMALLAFFWSASLPLVEALTFTHLGAQASRYGAIRLWGSVGFIAAVLGLGWLLDRLPLSATLWVSAGILGGILACALVLPEKREERHETDRLPIGDILLASNANLTVPEFLQTGEWRPRPSIATLASAMDVGNPSNMERLRWLFPERDRLAGRGSAQSVSDDEIRATIRRDHRELGQTWCPHTATAACVYRRLDARRAAERWVLVATAHPAKFNDIVEPLIGTEVPVPPALAALLALPARQVEIGARLEDLRRVLVGSA